MKAALAFVFLLASSFAFSQSPVSDITDSLGLARLKNYSAGARIERQQVCREQ